MQFMGVKVGWPLDSNIIRRGSENNTFGFVRRNVDGSPRPHQGWDLYAKSGTPVFSVSDGEVAYAGTAGALGNLLVISIGDSGKYAAYAHLSKISVLQGEKINLGQHVGYTGNTGNAVNMSGPDEHLHFEVRDKPLTGLGLSERISPFALFGHVPYKTPVPRK